MSVENSFQDHVVTALEPAAGEDAHPGAREELARSLGEAFATVQEMVEGILARAESEAARILAEAEPPLHQVTRPREWLEQAAAETEVVGPNGRVWLTPRALDTLIDVVRGDNRLWKTREELEVAITVQVPPSERHALCDVLGSWLGGMSEAELTNPQVQEIAALYAAQYLPDSGSAIADVA
jgi:hypothetical protein